MSRLEEEVVPVDAGWGEEGEKEGLVFVKAATYLLRRVLINVVE